MKYWISHSATCKVSGNIELVDTADCNMFLAHVAVNSKGEIIV